jgi:hypothetical protein
MVLAAGLTACHAKPKPGVLGEQKAKALVTKAMGRI